MAIAVVTGLAVGGSWLVDQLAPVGRAPASVASPSPAPQEPGPAPGRPHLVQPGDTYWSIAVAVDGPGDVRARVDALQDANGGRSLQVGDVVVVPR